MTKSILVTGGAGFIGSCFVRRALAARSARIVVLDKLTYAGNLESLPRGDTEGYQFVRGDIGDLALMRRLLADVQPASVVNFAAETHVDRSIDGYSPFVETNVVGTVNLLTCCREFFEQLPESQQQEFRFLHVSTDEVYGSLGSSGKFHETTPYAPNSPYAASKAASDMFVRAIHHTYGLPTLITNCSNNYGPYQYPEKLIPLMILNALEGKPLPVYGDGLNVRDWLFVEDHCRAIELVLERGRPGETYNIGGYCERSNIAVVREICRCVAEVCDNDIEAVERLISYVPDRPGHDRRYAIDASKIHGELGWLPSVTFEIGLRRTVQWYVENLEWVQSVSNGKYSRERLGLDRISRGVGSDAPAVVCS
jgi:dTDP-glucose 4,6-dehydratase